MPHINDKVADWSARFGHILRASAETQFSHLYKGAVGGLEHVVSVDNGAYYMELWRSGENEGNYYATTGAAIKPLPGLAKGARLDEALDRFFTLMSKVEKDKAAMKRRLNMHNTPKSPHKEHAQGGAREARKPVDPAGAALDMAKFIAEYAGKSLEEVLEIFSYEKNPLARKAIPKKIKRLLGLKKERRIDPGWSATEGNRSFEYERKKPKPPIKKRVMEKVDPEIGPSQSVGHRKPSDLSPESGVSKLARSMIRNLVGEPTAQMRKNVVALTAPGGVGNQPGSGRVKPGTGVKVTDPMQPAKPGTPPKTYRSPQGFSGRRMGAPGAPGAPAGTSGSGIKRGEKLGQKTSQRRAPYVGSRPAGVSSPLLRRRRKIDDITGGRVGAGGKITPVKPGKGGPGQPTGYGSTGNPQYSYGRKAAKGCDCRAAEIAKALREIQ